MTLIYCYGIIEDDLKVSMKGFEDKSIYLIPFQDIHAVVSDVPEEKFSQKSIDKNVKDMKWLTENGQIHEEVIEKIMKKTTIIPMKFCTIFKGKEKVEEILKEKYADFKYNLKNLKNKIEMSLKIYYDSNPLKKKILEENQELKKQLEKAEEKTKTSPGAAYFDKQKVDILLKEEIQKKLSREKKEIFEKIKAFSIDSKENEPLNKKLTGKDMLLNSVFLINNSDIEKFKQEVEKIKQEHKQLEFQVFGHFPPYNFIS